MTQPWMSILPSAAFGFVLVALAFIGLVSDPGPAEWFGLLSVYVAVWSVIGAWRATAAAEQASRVGALLSLVESCHSREMHEAVVKLRAYEHAQRGGFPSTFAHEVRNVALGQPSEVDLARRTVSTYLDKVWAASRWLDDTQLRLCMTKQQAQFYLEVVEPLEAVLGAELSMDYNREPFDWLKSRFSLATSPSLPLKAS